MIRPRTSKKVKNEHRCHTFNLWKILSSLSTMSQLRFLVDILKLILSNIRFEDQCEKSVLLGLNCVEGDEEELAREIGCGKESWPITYLGVPLGGNRMKISL